MNQAIDKAQIAEVAYLGHANAAESLIYSESKWFNDALVTYPKGERILTLRQTARLRNMSCFDILVDAMNAYFKEQKPDLSWMYE